MIKDWFVQRQVLLLLISEPAVQLGPLLDPYIAFIDRHGRKCIHCGCVVVVWSVFRTDWEGSIREDTYMDAGYTTRPQACLSRPGFCEFWEPEYRPEMSCTLYRS